MLRVERLHEVSLGFKTLQAVGTTADMMYLLGEANDKTLFSCLLLVFICFHDLDYCTCRSFGSYKAAIGRQVAPTFSWLNSGADRVGPGAIPSHQRWPGRLRHDQNVSMVASGAGRAGGEGLEPLRDPFRESPRPLEV